VGRLPFAREKEIIKTKKQYTDKKEKKNCLLYIRKSRRDQLQSHK
jgi:hypothetical protein